MCLSGRRSARSRPSRARFGARPRVAAPGWGRRRAAVRATTEEFANQDWLTSAAARGSARCPARMASGPVTGSAGTSPALVLMGKTGPIGRPGPWRRPPNTKPPQPEGNLGISSSVTCSEPSFNGGRASHRCGGRRHRGQRR